MDANVGYVAAFAGGLVSFLSPCVLPLVPAYLSIIGGVSVTDQESASPTTRLRILRDTCLFISGFSFVFVTLGLSLTTLGKTLIANQSVLTTISGAVVVGMAVFLLLTRVLPSPRLLAEYRFHPRPSRFGIFAAPVAGAAFAFGWTPCFGPILASLLAVASTQAETARAGSLLAAYSLGLGVPFLATGLAFGRLAGALAWFKRHGRALDITAALVLGFFGVLLVADQLSWVTSTVQAALDAVGLDWLINAG